MCFDTRNYVYTISYDLLLDNYDDVMNKVCYAVISKNYVYISYYFIHLSLHMCRYKLMCFDTRNFVYTILYNLLLLTSCIH